MKIWDLRSDSKEPNNTFMLSGDQVTPTCLTFHPTQRHLILAGDDLGEFYFCLQIYVITSGFVSINS